MAVTHKTLTLADPTIYLLFSMNSADLKSSDFTASSVQKVADDYFMSRLHSRTVPQPTISRSTTTEITGWKLPDGEDAQRRLALETTLPVALERTARLYPEGVCIVRLILRMQATIAVDDLNYLINHSLDKSLLWMTSTLGLPVSCDALIPGLDLVRTSGTGTPSYIESFSVVEPSRVIPTFDDANKYRGVEYEMSLFDAAIRRMPDFSEVNLEIPRTVQRNLSSYKSDLIYLNYHHLFIYVPVNRGHLASSFYIDLTEAIKVLVALLHSFDISTYGAIAEMGTIPRSLGSLRRQTEAVESNRLTIVRTLDAYRILTTASASRARWFVTSVTEIFGTAGIERSLNEKLAEVQTLLSTRYDIALQRTMQLLAITVATLSLIATAVGIVLSVLLASGGPSPTEGPPTFAPAPTATSSLSVPR